MTNMVELGEDSGVELTVTASISEDADEDGRYMHRSQDTEYLLWVGPKHWSGSSSNRSSQHLPHLKQHLKEFSKVLEEQDPEGHKKAGF
jgi:hypothetical protein